MQMQSDLMMMLISRLTAVMSISRWKVLVPLVLINPMVQSITNWILIPMALISI